MFGWWAVFRGSVMDGHSAKSLHACWLHSSRYYRRGGQDDVIEFLLRDLLLLAIKSSYFSPPIDIGLLPIALSLF